MTALKRIVRLHVDGTSTALDTFPTWDAMRAWVGGDLEQVQVLRDDGRLTYLLVNEDGRNLDLPRNDQATRRYHGLIQARLSPEENPYAAFRAALRDITAWMDHMSPPTVIPLASPDEVPWIAGEAVYFEGYTCEELMQIWNRDTDDKETL